MFIPMSQDEGMPTQTRHSRELASRVERAIRDFQRDHPELTDDEIRAALASTARLAPGQNRRLPVRRRVGLVAGATGAVLAGGFALVNERSGGGQLAWLVAAGALLVAAIVVALLVAARR